jgi:exodeoxyribonuclease VII small subunit
MGDARAGERRAPHSEALLFFLSSWVLPFSFRAASPAAGLDAMADKKDAHKPPANFEAAMGELESLVARVEAGDLPLEQIIREYKRGAELLAFCRKRLGDADRQIRILEGGVLKPFIADNGGGE